MHERQPLLGSCGISIIGQPRFIYLLFLSPKDRGPPQQKQHVSWQEKNMRSRSRKAALFVIRTELFVFQNLYHNMQKICPSLARRKKSVYK